MNTATFTCITTTKKANTEILLRHTYKIKVQPGPMGPRPGKWHVVLKLHKGYLHTFAYMRLYDQIFQYDN